MFDPGAAGRDIGAVLPQPGESSEVLISSLTLSRWSDRVFEGEVEQDYHQPLQSFKYFREIMN